MDTITDYALNKDDIAAIKEAHSLVVFWRPDLSEGPVSGIRLGIDVSLSYDNAEVKLARIVKSGRWTRTYASEHSVDFNRTIPAGLAGGVTLYQGDSIDRSPARSAVWVETMLRSDTAVRSVLLLLKAGDQIAVKFVGSNNSDTLRNVNFHRDECYLQIHRNGKLFGEFLMDVMVGPDNTARMVQR